MDDLNEMAARTCPVCRGEPYAAHDGEGHVDTCPGCGECSGFHGGTPTHPEGIRIHEERAEALRVFAEEQELAELERDR